MCGGYNVIWIPSRTRLAQVSGHSETTHTDKVSELVAFATAGWYQLHMYVVCRTGYLD